MQAGTYPRPSRLPQEGVAARLARVNEDDDAAALLELWTLVAAIGEDALFACSGIDTFRICPVSAGKPVES